MAGTKERVVSTRVREEFVIEVEWNPTTGYQWNPLFPADRVRLVRREGAPSREPGDVSDVNVGAGRTERFVFEALTPGDTGVEMELKRAWETTPIETRTYRVKVRR